MMVLSSMVVAVLCSLPGRPLASPWPPTPSSDSQPNHLNQQRVETALAGLEGRVEELERARSEAAAEALTRRLAGLEARTARDHRALLLRMDTLTQTIDSCELKEDLAQEQLGRKMEAVQERLNKRLSYIETRLEAVFNKLEDSVEGSLAKVETKQAELRGELSTVATHVGELRTHVSQWEEKTNHTSRALVQCAQRWEKRGASQEEVDKIGQMLANIESQVSSRRAWQSQSDGPALHHKEDLLGPLRAEIATEARTIANKVNNMYEDLWRKVIHLEELIRSAVSTTNLTRLELQDEIRSFIMDNSDGDVSESYLQMEFDSLQSMVQRKLGELGRKVEGSLVTLSTAQTMVFDTCRQLHEDQPLLENKVSLVLEKILDTILNRTAGVRSELAEVGALVREGSAEAARGAEATRSLVLDMAEERNVEYKLLAHTLYDLTTRVLNVTALLQGIKDEMLGQPRKPFTKHQGLVGVPHYKLQEFRNVTVTNASKEKETVNNSKIEAHKDRDEVNEKGVIRILTEIDGEESKVEEEEESSAKSGGSVRGQVRSVGGGAGRERKLADSQVIAVMMLFIKLRSGEVSEGEFLRRAGGASGEDYPTVDALLATLRPAPNVPQEFLAHLERWDQARHRPLDSNEEADKDYSYYT